MEIGCCLLITLSSCVSIYLLHPVMFLIEEIYRLLIDKHKSDVSLPNANPLLPPTGTQQ